jgi:hypothetical protein
MYLPRLPSSIPRIIPPLDMIILVGGELKDSPTSEFSYTNRSAELGILLSRMAPPRQAYARCSV